MLEDIAQQLEFTEILLLFLRNQRMPKTFFKSMTNRQSSLESSSLKWDLRASMLSRVMREYTATQEKRRTKDEVMKRLRGNLKKTPHHSPESRMKRCSEKREEGVP